MKENSQRVKNIKVAQTIDLVTGLLLLLLVQGPEGNTGDLDDLETDTRNITNGVTGTTETGNEDLVVLCEVGKGKSRFAFSCQSFMFNTYPRKLSLTWPIDKNWPCKHEPD